MGCDCELTLASKHQEHLTPVLLMAVLLSITVREPEAEVTFLPAPENALFSRKSPWMLWTWLCGSEWVISTCERRGAECLSVHICAGIWMKWCGSEVTAGDGGDIVLSQSSSAGVKSTG